MTLHKISPALHQHRLVAVSDSLFPTALGMGRVGSRCGNGRRDFSSFGVVQHGLGPHQSRRHPRPLQLLHSKRGHHRERLHLTFGIRQRKDETGRLLRYAALVIQDTCKGVTLFCVFMTMLFFSHRSYCRAYRTKESNAEKRR